MPGSREGEPSDPAGREPWAHRAHFALLYFSEGAPIGFVWWALPALLAEAGWDAARITGLTSVLVLPWAGKALWAPVLEPLFRRGLHKAVIAAAQIGMGLLLLPLAVQGVEGVGEALLGLLLAHAVLAASQDVAIDAMCIATIEPEELGSMNGWMQAGMLVGRAAFGGGFLLLATQVTPAVAFGLLVAAIWAPMVALWRAPSVPIVSADAAPRGVMWRVLRRPATLVALVFAATAGAAFEGAGAVASPLLKGLGATVPQIGAFYAAPVLVLTGAGALIGGRLSDRWGQRRTVAAAGVGMVCTVLSLGAAPTTSLAFVALGAMMFAIGAFTSSSYALLMASTDPRVAGTQFSAYMGMTNLCEAWAARWIGQLHQTTGSFGVAFVPLAVVSLAALPLMRWIPLRSSVATRATREEP